MDKPDLRYLPQLDGLRALAILMIFAHHSLGVPLLWSGVDLFFILSGYLITGILLRDCEQMRLGEMLRRFYTRRAERILPAYILFLAIAYWFVKAEWHLDWPYYVLFLQNIPYGLHPDRFGPLAPLWSLAIEQHFYLVWPFLVFFFPRRWLVPCMLTLLLGTPILRAVCTPLFPSYAAIYALTPFRLDAMAAGALAALTLPHCNRAAAIRLALTAMALGIGLYAVLGYHHPWFSRAANSAAFNGAAYSLNILVLGGLFVLVVLCPGLWTMRLLANPVMRWLGRISYSFYLFHQLVYFQLVTRMGFYQTAFLSFAATVAIASLSWILLEKPILSLSASHRRRA